jgi:hypothetical protein
MAETLNQQLADGFVRRDLAARREERQHRRAVWAALALLEADLLAALKANDPTDFTLVTRRRRAVEALMADELDPLIQTRYAAIAARVETALVRLARDEAGAVPVLVAGVTDEETVQEVPSASAVRRRVTDGLFPSAATATDLSTTGADWWQRQADSLSQRLGDSLTVGVTREETLTQLAQRIRGTSENGFTDGLMAKARTDAARLLTTQTTQAVSAGRVAVAEGHTDQFVLEHSSIIDSRTSIVCLGRNGLRYRSAPPHEGIGHSIPYLGGVPYHNSCRSSILSVFVGGGAVRQETLTAWLHRQGAAVQEDLLGPGRARLFRAGTLRSTRDLLDAVTGRPLTLDELGGTS